MITIPLVLILCYWDFVSELRADLEHSLRLLSFIPKVPVENGSIAITFFQIRHSHRSANHFNEMQKKKKNSTSYGSKVVKSIMLLSKVASVPLLSFLLLASIAILGFDVPSPVNSYATSNNNSKENASSPISSATSNGKRA